MTIPRPCIHRRCPEYSVPGGSRCATHLAEFEAKRRADPELTGRRGTSPEWRRARGLSLWRHGNCCLDCGDPLAAIQARGDKLEVDHVDGDANNNRQSNLEPRCTPCHLAKHMKP